MSERFPVPPRIQERALINRWEEYSRLYRESLENRDDFWATQARLFLTWDRDFSQTSSCDYRTGTIEWFSDGQLNVSKNCIDRHLVSRGEKPAILWEGNELGERKTITYRELHSEVCRFANMLTNLGVSKGDRVIIYLPMIPELAYSMLACARIGAVHSVVFAGFSAESLGNRIEDCQAKVVITANEGLRGPKTIPLKSICDEAVLDAQSVKAVVVVRRTSNRTEMKSGRDFWSEELLATASPECAPVVLDAEDPLFILYTSGSTGKPKGLVHTQAGYLLYTAFTHKFVFDYHEDDIYCCVADCGWITGHSYIVYGPLANGATTVMFESTPTYPDPGRYWEMIDRLGVTSFYTAPTAIRALEKEGEIWPEKYSLESLRILGSVGEPINEDAWLWYYNHVGHRRCTIVDTWWQTETGGILISPLPGVTETKPGSATFPLFGIDPVLIDDNGKEVSTTPGKGRLCIRDSWPGQSRTVFGDHDRFFDTYFREIPGMYLTGDAAERDSDGYFWIRGRVDDVLNVSGHRLGTAEIESAIDHCELVVEAAVVGIPHEVKGTGIYAFCIASREIRSVEEAEFEVKNTVRKVIGPFAAPDHVQFVTGLPKTRSGKIMRRILRKIASGDLESLGDISTLADSAVVEEIVSGRKR
ncbi:MAG: acetate--CoA ligase [Bdellovibrionales bacterium]|nr:acetate--CoA ligase [Bdellovibrionales bacterium]